MITGQFAGHLLYPWVNDWGEASTKALYDVEGILTAVRMLIGVDNGNVPNGVPIRFAAQIVFLVRVETRSRKIAAIE